MSEGLPFTVEEVERRVEAIRASARDDEAAHGSEDDLHQAVLAVCAAGHPASAALAAAALKTLDIRFSRWCA